MKEVYGTRDNTEGYIGKAEFLSRIHSMMEITLDWVRVANECIQYDMSSEGIEPVLGSCVMDILMLIKSA